MKKLLRLAVVSAAMFLPGCASNMASQQPKNESHVSFPSKNIKKITVDFDQNTGLVVHQELEYYPAMGWVDEFKVLPTDYNIVCEKEK